MKVQQVKVRQLRVKDCWRIASLIMFFTSRREELALHRKEEWELYMLRPANGNHHVDNNREW